MQIKSKFPFWILGFNILFTIIFSPHLFFSTLSLIYIIMINLIFIILILFLWSNYEIKKNIIIIKYFMKINKKEVYDINTVNSISLLKNREVKILKRKLLNKQVYFRFYGDILSSKWIVIDHNDKNNQRKVLGLTTNNNDKYYYHIKNIIEN